MAHSFDFHAHSWWSYDAHLSPAELFAAAESASLTALAITDHHNMDGFDEFAAAAADHPAVRWVRAMELSVRTDWGEFDVVALGVPPDAPRQVADVIDRYRDWMRRFNRALLAGLEAAGIGFGRSEADQMLAAWRPGPARTVQGETRIPNVGLADWLARRGLIEGEAGLKPIMDRAFAAAAGKPPVPPADEVLPRYRQMGAVLILAHPTRFLADRGPRELDELIARTGIDGVEAGHLAHTPQQAAAYLEYARARGLLVSGGADVHFPRDLPNLGVHHCDKADAAALMKRLGL